MKLKKSILSYRMSLIEFCISTILKPLFSFWTHWQHWNRGAFSMVWRRQRRTSQPKPCRGRRLWRPQRPSPHRSKQSLTFTHTWRFSKRNCWGKNYYLFSFLPKNREKIVLSNLFLTKRGSYSWESERPLRLDFTLNLLFVHFHFTTHCPIY